ncbi:hypothetical protein [Xenorhabdus szentirmaii]|uniref:Uncharacterized protein n=1 Tax=Xenorhabdus szentirmaii DSM 16338 TaxID=1427518 RepID=W1J3S7_9GAMM|nr:MULTISPECIES: hypothetical protein [Xenorhabdus]MBD2780105.1 hypothetical protein [Xenorhabdus sp. 38]CDL84728.1 hypothetical protein XSR1_50130 [Xenorhabdus szentirmaii DSM 16338]
MHRLIIHYPQNCIQSGQGTVWQYKQALEDCEAERLIEVCQWVLEEEQFLDRAVTDRSILNLVGGCADA